MKTGCRGYAFALAALLLAFSGWQLSARAEQAVTVWSYHHTVPFLEEGGGGLNRDFVEMLNARGRGRFRFLLHFLPRKRIDMELDRGEPGVVLFVNPEWMRDSGRTRHLWTGPFLMDSDEIISRRSRPVEYAGVESLTGLKLGGMLGWKYDQFEEAFSRGDIVREDTAEARHNLLKLIEGRVDFVVFPRVQALPLIKAMGVADRLHFSARPLAPYARHVLVTRNLPHVFEFLEEVQQSLSEDAEWQRLRQRHGLE
ncbi:substrate-binding periplasmic protein [Pseudodesulfovibrio tunisiensis]|uniref:substrate-binding periplasmic protein n=1 Tax=Pseudodesulfovibrio tunisiensis TaxID=463192 RepID=UPI001FB1BDD3|nr:transporter substrate-binding domain-containing protein [Pseudodesulfovibrio tunisiensis]